MKMLYKDQEVTIKRPGKKNTRVVFPDGTEQVVSNESLKKFIPYAPTKEEQMVDQFFNDTIVRSMQKEINQFMDTLSSKYGFDFVRNNCSYSSPEASFSIKFASRKRGEFYFPTICKIYDIDPDCLGKCFKTGSGAKRIIIGAETGRSTDYIILSDEDKKNQYRIRADQFKNAVDKGLIRLIDG